MNDPIADMLTRIRNAIRAALPEVGLPHSRIKESIARVLQSEGYVQSVSVEGDKKKTLKIRLKYSGERTP
jgi:small subunit ribosomal protein S8